MLNTRSVDELMSTTTSTTLFLLLLVTVICLMFATLKFSVCGFGGTGFGTCFHSVNARSAVLRVVLPVNELKSKRYSLSKRVAMTLIIFARVVDPIVKVRSVVVLMSIRTVAAVLVLCVVTVMSVICAILKMSFFCAQRFASASRVFAPIDPQPVESSSPLDAMPCFFWNRFTASRVFSP